MFLSEHLSNRLDILNRFDGGEDEFDLSRDPVWSNHWRGLFERLLSYAADNNWDKQSYIGRFMKQATEAALPTIMKDISVYVWGIPKNVVEFLPPKMAEKANEKAMRFSHDAQAEAEASRAAQRAIQAQVDEKNAAIAAEERKRKEAAEEVARKIEEERKKVAEAEAKKKAAENNRYSGPPI